LKFSTIIQELERRLSLLEADKLHYETVISAQRVQLTEQSAIIVSQQAEIAELKRLLGLKEVRKTSKNSHSPPSTDLTRKNQSLREKSDKPVGGQKGHKGYTLKMSECPDEVKKLHPSYCNACGLCLVDRPSILVGRRQVVDIAPILPTITEYRNFEVACRCGHHQRGSYPSNVSNHIQYGANLQSLVVYQSVYQYVPFKRLQDFFLKVTNVALSKGTIENILRRTAHKAEGTYESIRKIVTISFFVGSDETSAKVKGDKHWFWVWQTAIVTYILAACTRSKQVIAATFPDGLPHSILCSDRLAAQLSTCTKGTQICLVHLLRDLNYLIDVEQTQWAMDFKTLLKDAMELKRQQNQYDKADEKVLNIELRANELLDKSFEQLGWTTDSQHRTMTFLKGMVKLRHALFPFLYHAEVPPDNNGSERAVRPIKVKMKISGQFKSLQQEFAILRSVIDTAIKNGQPVFEAIRAIVAMPY
jgi:transposase